MIPASIRTRQPSTTSSWQEQLAQAISSSAQLLEVLGLTHALAPGVLDTAPEFALRVPWSYVRRMRRGDARDPLLRQVLPLTRERVARPGFVADPLAEQAALRAPGLLHKYHGRALLIATGACAVHCRYCFRREFPYAAQVEAPRWHEALACLQADPSIEEVILSGGDPLALSDARLAALTRALQGIAHVRRLRVHTRLPIALPARVDSGLSAWLGALERPIVIVLHANHANEIDAEVADACARLRAAGATLLNQSVLLRGVNDSVEALSELSQRLFAAGVLPYYLHVLDPVRGTAHYRVPARRARVLVGTVAARLPGYLVPRLVRERAGAPAKVPLRPLLPS
jgi:EF-P beta-lysylation protein EpmB